MTNGETLRRLNDIVTYPKEDLSTELKGWLDLDDEMDRANLARALMAIANHGGGHVLIGFTNMKGQWVPAEPRPADLSGYSEDDCNAVLRYAEPPFHCDVYFPARHDSNLQFPIIVVPGNHRAPIRAKRDDPRRKHIRQNEYYIRRPGPKSEPPQSGQEWDALIRRCIQAGREELLDEIRRILSGPSELRVPPESAMRELDAWEKESEDRWRVRTNELFSSMNESPYALGVWAVAYELLGDFERPSLAQLLEILDTVRGHETGWPPWWVPTRADIKPYVYEASIECWLASEGDATNKARDPAHADFWRASPEGKMFLVRGYQEDSTENERYKVGTIFDVTLPVWRVGEVLLHASRLAEAFKGSGAGQIDVHLRTRWIGLKDRMLVSWAQTSIFLPSDRTCRQDEVRSELVAHASAIPSELPEMVARLTLPLYEAFDFFVPSDQMYEEQLSRMRSRGV